VFTLDASTICFAVICEFNATFKIARFSQGVTTAGRSKLLYSFLPIIF